MGNKKQRQTQEILKRLRHFCYERGLTKSPNAKKSLVVHLFLTSEYPQLSGCGKWAKVLAIYETKSHSIFVERLPRKQRKRRLKTNKPTRKKHTTEYLSYLQSREWQLKRLELFSVRGRICERCNRNLDGERADVHHITYDNLFNEPLSDLMVLCRPCHNSIHSNKKRKKT